MIDEERERKRAEQAIEELAAEIKELENSIRKDKIVLKDKKKLKAFYEKGMEVRK